jgi:predicted SAM-dependent methyltransferase
LIRSGEKVKDGFMLDISKIVVSFGEKPVRLHLGCGPRYLEGYINIDRCSDQPISKVKVDLEANILDLQCKENCIDEVRSHHVFEHFDRVQALSLLIKWSLWLKPNGVLHISTPDSEGEIAKFRSSNSFQTRMLAVRHMMGSHEAEWGYHLDLWFEERFQRTLDVLGFCNLQINRIAREDGFFDIDVQAKKGDYLNLEYLLKQSEVILRDSAVLPIEEPLVGVWMNMLRRYLC